MNAVPGSVGIRTLGGEGHPVRISIVLCGSMDAPANRSAPLKLDQSMGTRHVSGRPHLMATVWAGLPVLPAARGFIWLV
jgi:hypothetical protein